MAQLAPGTPVFFRLKSPRNAIAGYGFYSHFVLLGLQQAWHLFGGGNGDANLESFLTRIGGYRGMDLLSTPSARLDPLGQGAGLGHEHRAGQDRAGTGPGEFVSLSD